MSGNGAAVVRVILQRVDEGDKKKAIAKSNESNSGGGARDLRFRPETEFLPVFQRMFPHKSTKTRKSRKVKGATSQIEVLSGTVAWHEPTGQKSATMEVWPATDARKNECRIARISSLAIDGLIEKDPNGGRSVLMLFQQANGDIWLYFTTETSLLTQNWDPTIKKFAQDWFDDGCKSAFLDLATKEQYPHV